MTAILTTERLILRPMTYDHMEAVHQLYNDDIAMRFVPSPPHQSVAETRERFDKSMATEGTIRWVVCLKETDTVIGEVLYLGGTRIQGMGYILHPDYWGKGYTAEACQVALKHGFETIGYERIELWIDEENTQSQRVAQKLGFGLKGQLSQKFPHETLHRRTLVWGLTQADYLSETSSDSKPVFFSVEPVLHVHDVVLTSAYYQDKLGFRIDFLYGQPPTHAGVSWGEWTGSGLSIQLSKIPKDTPIQPAGYLHIRVSDVDALFAQYRDNGVTIISEPEDKPWGFREFTLEDLNGHRMIFAGYLS